MSFVKSLVECHDEFLDAACESKNVQAYFMGYSLDAPDRMPAGSSVQGIVQRNACFETIRIIPYRSHFFRDGEK